jgi:HPt (histidine-containing phosphotransfer) domain-containing protein
VNYAAFNEVRALIGTERTFGLLSDFARDLGHRFRSEAPGDLALDAHAMISSAGVFGFKELVCACRDMEEACRTGCEVGALRTRLDQARRDTLDEIDWLRIAG